MAQPTAHLRDVTSQVRPQGKEDLSPCAHSGLAKMEEFSLLLHLLTEEA